MALSEEKLCSVGCKWMYTFNCLEAKKFIPAYSFPQLPAGSYRQNAAGRV